MHNRCEVSFGIITNRFNDNNYKITDTLKNKDLLSKIAIYIINAIDCRIVELNQIYYREYDSNNLLEVSFDKSTIEN